MSVNPFYSPKFRAFDSNGDPLAGGLLYSYAAGTSTPLATYTTRAGTTANTNPVVLDANGEANVWTTQGVEYKFELRNSAGVVQWTIDNVPSLAEAESADTAIDPGGWLCLTNTVAPLVTANVTGATTLYYLPLKSNSVALYDGSAWIIHSIGTGLSQTTTDNTKSPAAVANNSTYDLFVWDDNGTIRLSRGPAWSTSTTRGTGAGTTELEQVDGRWVNKIAISNGPAAQRGLYVGTVRSDGSAQLNDSVEKPHVINHYGREPKPQFASGTGSQVYGESSASVAVKGSTATGTGVQGVSTGAGAGGSFSSTSGNAVEIGAGNAKFTAAGPAATAAQSNKQTSANLPKAWGVVVTNGAGAYTLTDGFNIGSVGASAGVNLNIAFPAGGEMASANYVVVANFSGGGSTIAGVASKSTTGFTLNGWVETTGAIDWGSGSYTVHFVVFGRQ